MAIATGSKIAITLVMGAYNQVQMNVWGYNVLELVGTPTAAHYAEAWWNHVKTNYRGLCSVGQGNVFRSVRVLELGNPTGEYGEYAIASGEQPGTRANPTDGDIDAPHSAAGVRLTVSTRLTRPGQKRIGFLTQSDTANGVLGAGYITGLNALMGTMTANMTLGAPAAGVVLVPTVISLNSNGTIRTSQAVHGYVINQYVTTQNSRKFNRGM